MYAPMFGFTVSMRGRNRASRAASRISTTDNRAPARQSVLDNEWTVTRCEASSLVICPCATRAAASCRRVGISGRSSDGATFWYDRSSMTVTPRCKACVRILCTEGMAKTLPVALCGLLMMTAP